MEQLILEHILIALKNQDYKQIVGYGLIFFLIWREVRGLKKELHKMNETLANKFTEGETRFQNIEQRLDAAGIPKLTLGGA